MIFAIIGVACSIVPYVIMGDMVAKLIDGNRDWQFYLRDGIIMAVFWIGRVTFHGISTSCSHKATFHVLATIRKRLCDKLAKVPLGLVKDTPSGSLKNIMVERVDSIETTLAHGKGRERMKQMDERSKRLGLLQKKLNGHEASQVSLTNMAILFFSFGMLFLMLGSLQSGKVTHDEMLITTIAMLGSFGPVIALANLSNNLNQTLASGERVLSLLEEEPQTAEVAGETLTVFHGAAAGKVNFAYEEEQILKDYTIAIPKGKVVGIYGASGSGKSTLLKLFMRFWDADSGKILISEKDIKKVNTVDLRDMESYVTQETHLFHDSIANNIAIGKPGASPKEIVEAAKKASIHDFIMTLPKGYDTEVGELGDNLSGGEKQRIGIARAFLHDAPFLLLDEPTSNLDALNEGIILKSLKEARGEKTVLLVSHRKSTMNLADVVYEMGAHRVS